MNSLVPTLPSTRRAYATHPYAQYCCGSLCLSKPAVRISPSASAGTSFFFTLRHTYKARLVYICNTTSLFAASSVYSGVRSNNATAPGVLCTLRQRLKQATYYAHRADARCTLSSTAKMFFVVVGIGKYMRIRTYLLLSLCDRHLLLRTDHLWIVCFRNESVVRASYTAGIRTKILTTVVVTDCCVFTLLTDRS